MTKRTKCLLFSAAFFAAFSLLVLLLLTVDRAPIGAAGETVGLSSLNLAVHESLGYHPFFKNITDASGVLLIANGLFFAFMGFRSLFVNKKFSLVEREYYFLAALYIVMASVYFLSLFDSLNFRPIILEGDKARTSFPSSHVLLAICIGASALPMYRMIFKDRPKCILVGDTVSCTLLLVTVLGRTISGLHWITDVFGGLLLGWALVMLFFACIIRKEKA